MTENFDDGDENSAMGVMVGTGIAEELQGGRSTMPMPSGAMLAVHRADVEGAFGVPVRLQERVTSQSTQPQHESDRGAFRKQLRSLMKIAQRVSPEARGQVAKFGANVNIEEFSSLRDLYATIEFLNRRDEKANRSLHSILRTHTLDQFERAASWKGVYFPETLRANALLLDFPEDQRWELLRQKTLYEDLEQKKDYEAIKGQMIDRDHVMALIEAIDALEKNPTLQCEREFTKQYPAAKGLDLPVSTDTDNTRLLRALVALRNEYEAQLQGNPDIDMIRRSTRNFVLGILNPEKTARFANITDVYGSEANVPNSENDGTRLRVHEHRREVGERYGVKLDVFDQGTSIKCPEQCGFYALVAVNQARRMHRGKKIAARFFALNNAARTEDADNLKSGEKSKSTSLVYFTFDVGDGMLHSGVAYGHQTLTYLKPYIIDLCEIQGTDSGTQFRSLEFQQHIATLVAMTGGAFPAAYKGTKLDKDEIIPEPNLGENEIQFMGMDKYGNGMTSVPARQIFEKYLASDEKATHVFVTLLDRKKQPIKGVYSGFYTLARSLGEVRDGSPALWESSTPTTENPQDGFLSIGMFMQKPGDTNADVISLPAGSYIRIQKLQD